ncbi:hypothetical protein B0H19DRAFT_1274332 [Mycena capillaripes]|nr:hypothetical protein B0H19DRAFT_1274332 [Mycena capillaripes]
MSARPVWVFLFDFARYFTPTSKQYGRMAAQFLVLPAFVELSQDWYIIASPTGVAHEHRHRYEVRLSIVSRHIVVGRVLTLWHVPKSGRIPFIELGVPICSLSGYLPSVVGPHPQFTLLSVRHFAGPSVFASH